MFTRGTNDGRLFFAIYIEGEAVPAKVSELESVLLAIIVASRTSGFLADAKVLKGEENSAINEANY